MRINNIYNIFLLFIMIVKLNEIFSSKNEFYTYFKSFNSDNIIWNKYEVKYQNFNKVGTSQNGEDGFLNYLFSKIKGPNEKGYYVEFGAGDGYWLSNTWYFREKKGWDGLLMEGNSEGHISRLNDSEKKRLNLHLEMVSGDNINDLFKKYNVPNNFDLLSIDIDSHDYWCWKGITDYNPSIVIIETNPGIPNILPLTFPKDKKCEWVRNEKHYGTNLLALYRLAEEKGYCFVNTIKQNAIFIKKDLFPKLDMDFISESECIKKYYKYYFGYVDRIADSLHNEWETDSEQLIYFKEESLNNNIKKNEYELEKGTMDYYQAVSEYPQKFNN